MMVPVAEMEGNWRAALTPHLPLLPQQPRYQSGVFVQDALAAFAFPGLEISLILSHIDCNIQSPESGHGTRDIRNPRILSMWTHTSMIDSPNGRFLPLIQFSDFCLAR